MYGVNLNNTGLDYTVSLSAGAYMVQGVNTYQISQLFGVWGPPATPSSITLDYDALNQGAVTNWGFHLQWSDANGNTYTCFIGGARNAVPEPASLAFLALRRNLASRSTQKLNPLDRDFGSEVEAGARSRLRLPVNHIFYGLRHLRFPADFVFCLEGFST